MYTFYVESFVKIVQLVYKIICTLFNIFGLCVEYFIKKIPVVVHLTWALVLIIITNIKHLINGIQIVCWWVYKFFRATCTNTNVIFSLYITQGIGYASLTHFIVTSIRFIKELIHISDNSLNALGFYCLNVEKNDTLAIEYWEMAVSRGNADAMYNLGCYYENKKNEMCEEYYLQAITKGCVKAMGKLGTFYSKKLKYIKALKYWKMAVSHNCMDSMEKLGMYYANSTDNSELEQAVKYLVMVCDHRHDIMEELIEISCMDLLFDTQYLIYKCIFESKNLFYEKQLLNKIDNFETWKILNKLKENGIRLSVQVENKFKQLFETETNIKIFKQRLVRAKKYNELDTCPICWEPDVLNIDLGCGHGVCYSCYDPKLTCYYRCENYIT